MMQGRDRLGERHQAHAGRERRSPDFDRIVKGKVPRRRLLRYARERAVRVDLRANRAQRAPVCLARANLVETAQPGPIRAAERERESGRRRRLEIRIVAIDHGVPQAGLVLQRSDFVELERQRLAYLVNLRSKKSTRLNSSHLGISYAVFCLK